KGIRTGLMGERFGGQVLDTVDIENYISVPKTEGQKLAGALKAHVSDYDVDVIDSQSASKLVPAAAEGGLHQIETASGAVLKARSIIIATGAKWRNMNVPGEDQYRTKGVTYCPHCDGPLFKGKRVAVIGGGNSGVEAAIDLAGIVEHVTLLEFAPEMKADQVLQDKVRSLKNVDIILNAQTTEVKGDGSKVVGLEYRDRVSGDIHSVALAGIFVQIGLLPNTHWLEGALERNRMGEIIIDAKCETSVKGVFAAGDCTTVPYKQIIIATGEGAKASLSAFDYLIRTKIA
ncbi:alkyl hydroperoxide reductase subunit F, partial [Salmonella enterica subsp. enterica serovar Enteritidis]|nr:alkyl hydroperoxide reductase subunit F [Salmonella enterica subsp. enterica serovar Enteritidis]